VENKLVGRCCLVYKHLNQQTQQNLLWDRSSHVPLGFFKRRVTADTLEVARRERRSETLAECSSMGAVGSGALAPRRLSSTAADCIPRDALVRLPRPSSSPSIEGCDGTAMGDVPKRVAESESPETFPETMGPEIGAEMGLAGTGLGGFGGMRVELSAKRGNVVVAEEGKEDPNGAEPSTLDNGEGWNSGDTCTENSDNRLLQ
jgi:hypothetical protein